MTPDISSIFQIGGTIVAIVAGWVAIKIKVDNLEIRRKEDMEARRIDALERDAKQKLEIRMERHQELTTLRQALESHLSIVDGRVVALEVGSGRGAEKFESVERTLLEIKTDLRVLLNRRRGDRERSEGNET